MCGDTCGDRRENFTRRCMWFAVRRNGMSYGEIYRLTRFPTKGGHEHQGHCLLR